MSERLLAILRSRLMIMALMQFVRARDMDLWSGRLDSSKLPVPREPRNVWERFVNWLF